MYMNQWFKSGESNTEKADKIYMPPLHINISVQNLYQLLHQFIHLPIAALIHGTNQSRKIANDCEPLYLPSNNNHENTNGYESQTIDFRLLFFLASTAKVMSTVKTGISLLQAKNKWHSRDIAFTNMKNTIYLIIQDSSRVNHLQKQCT